MAWKYEQTCCGMFKVQRFLNGLDVGVEAIMTTKGKMVCIRSSHHIEVPIESNTLNPDVGLR